MKSKLKERKKWLGFDIEKTYKSVKKHNPTVIGIEVWCGDKHLLDYREPSSPKDNELKQRITNKNYEPLKCDRCGITIGFVDEFDLNSTYFLCLGCIKELRDELNNLPKDNEE